MDSTHTAKTLLCFGDSITRRGGLPPSGWVWQLQYRLATAEPGRWIVHNAGVGGNTTTLALDRFLTEVQPWLPAIVLVEFGINDCYIWTHAQVPRVSVDEYRRNLTEIARQIRAGGGTPVFIVNHPMATEGGHTQGNRATVEANIQPYNQTVRDLVIALSLNVIDIPQEVERRDIPREQILAGDGVHLSDAGESIYCDIVYSHLADSYFQE